MSSNDNQWVDNGDEEADYQVIAEGIASTVLRTLATFDDGEPQLVVVKTSTTIKKFAKEPHDIVKEARILKDLKHRNVVTILDVDNDIKEGSLSIWMYYISFSLGQLLDSPRLVPSVYPPNSTSSETYCRTRFEVVSRSIMRQLFSAITYIHDQNVAHRDIKPSNVLFTKTGCVYLIDFGIAWREGETENDKKADLWPEYRDDGKGMYFEVSTGPYRAPELIFGTRSYNPFAIDRWSLGCTLAEFFTPLTRDDNDDDERDYSYSSFRSTSSCTGYLRKSLFDGTRGEIGLAWSIFKLLGTPNETTWPGFKDLPDAERVEFAVAEPQPLTSSLPMSVPSVVDIIKRLLSYPPEQRLEAKLALEHQWFGQFPTLVPEDYPLDPGEDDRIVVIEDVRRTLGQLLADMCTEGG
ncbi:hypothetical protein E1B28_001944 [Marasmius oreades]|uniref:Protein kinase domain-containing protein n=1 Tax=Marasmius oreades TaxID=181124 RepID=A0A9P7V4E9_9AGAR|nr:uncharacterized protein E1B28_001944 [Marasmius oreades]KAG7100164.1 hypothetical protein E1B28_001944 [Marasmius oreades]